MSQNRREELLLHSSQLASRFFKSASSWGSPMIPVILRCGPASRPLSSSPIHAIWLLFSPLSLLKYSINIKCFLCSLHCSAGLISGSRQVLPLLFFLIVHWEFRCSNCSIWVRNWLVHKNVFPQKSEYDQKRYCSAESNIDWTRSYCRLFSTVLLWFSLNVLDHYDWVVFRLLLSSCKFDFWTVQYLMMKRLFLT